jgi:charged multivesicular body protein 1
MGNKVSLEEELINMRIVSKQMLRSSKKCEKNEKAAKEKLKKVCPRSSRLHHAVPCKSMQRSAMQCHDLICKRSQQAGGHDTTNLSIYRCCMDSNRAGRLLRLTVMDRNISSFLMRLNIDKVHVSLLTHLPLYPCHQQRNTQNQYCQCCQCYHHQAIQAGNTEGARIYAQDAIREKNQAISHLRMASRIDACSSRIETAVRMNQVTNSMKGVVKGMDKSLAAMDINQISQLMDKFEQQFEDLDVKTQYMEGSMNATTSSSTPAEQVDELIMITADENNLQLGDAFTEAGPLAKKQPALVVPAKKEDPVADSLEARLANLRN